MTLYAHQSQRSQMWMHVWNVFGEKKAATNLLRTYELPILMMAAKLKYHTYFSNGKHKSMMSLYECVSRKHAKCHIHYPTYKVANRKFRRRRKKSTTTSDTLKKINERSSEKNRFHKLLISSVVNERVCRMYVSHVRKDSDDFFFCLFLFSSCISLFIFLCFCFGRKQKKDIFETKIKLTIWKDRKTHRETEKNVLCDVNTSPVSSIKLTCSLQINQHTRKLRSEIKELFALAKSTCYYFESIAVFIYMDFLRFIDTPKQCFIKRRQIVLFLLDRIALLNNLGLLLSFSKEKKIKKNEILPCFIRSVWLEFKSQSVMSFQPTKKKLMNTFWAPNRIHTGHNCRNTYTNRKCNDTLLNWHTRITLANRICETWCFVLIYLPESKLNNVDVHFDLFFTLTRFFSLILFFSPNESMKKCNVTANALHTYLVKKSIFATEFGI